MSRAERLHAVACSIVRAVHHGRWHEKRVDAEASTNALVRELAEAAIDAADATREPGGITGMREACEEAVAMVMRPSDVQAITTRCAPRHVASRAFPARC